MSMNNQKLKIKSKKDGFGVSFGILDYLNLDYFYTPYSYMIYTIILADAEEKDNNGKGQIDIYKISKLTKISIDDIIKCFENLNEKNFVKFSINSKSISSESIYNLFTSKQDIEIENFLINKNGSIVELIEQFFHDKDINAFKKYKDHLNVSSLFFNYTISKHKKLKDIKSSVQFDQSVMSILNYFKKIRVFSCESFVLTDNFILINGQIIVKMIKDYRVIFPDLNDQKILEKIKDMIDYVFSDPWLTERAWDFSFIRKRENEIFQKINEFYKAYLKIKKDGNVEKMKDLVGFLENEIGWKLSHSQKKYCFLYFSEIINYQDSQLIRAFRSFAKDFSYVNNIDLKKISKKIQISIEESKKTLEERII